MNLNEQNSEKNLRFLVAQRRLYSKAKLGSYAMLFFGLLVFLAQFLKPTFPELNEYLTYLGFFSLPAIWLMDKATGKWIESAAKVQEEFDTQVFGMVWNESKAGGKLSKETVLEAAGNDAPPDDLKNWYEPQSLETIPSNLAVLLCQRYNASYEFRLKQRFARLLGWIFWLSVIGLMALGLWENGSFKDWLTNLLIPASGLLYKMLDLRTAFDETGKKQEDVFNDCEAEIEAYKKSKSMPPMERLRIFQDKVFEYRKQKSLVPDWLYSISKQGFEGRLTKATAEIIEELKK